MAETRRNARQNHIALAQQVLGVVLEEGLRQGDHLPEQRFSTACGVSRTPIRAAFKLLESKQILEWREEEGYFLRRAEPDDLARVASALDAQDGSLAARILADRAERRIGDVQSVSGLTRRYGTSRHMVLNALKILSRDGIVAQLPGRAWAFQPMFDSPKAIDDSYAMRLTLEPQAILAPGFALDPARANVLRGQIDDLLQSGPVALTAQGFLRLDCEFHGALAESCRNRFLRGTLLTHHRLRQATQKDTTIPEFRLRQALGEHLDILDALERGQFELAADHMVLHLRRSRARRTEAATRGFAPMKRGARR
ncbi:GntR family transcriptional regulator [Roseovarius sp. SCSIO 43702]|uniref:GntR family transcriptional regulator n=1 Tax=Roseovarius sp. SCSIO 43702 TaxID=2823043 RepID=UPI001C73C780|nr:GntR family transcriptional regulator [Roseovarius sp. SCSIO 43702]QYX55987.1 GntR family transcriptional regulator [Roseovarius sp. SCSIO 43702]